MPQPIAHRMPAALRRLRARIRRFGRAARGAVSVELALISPLLLTWYVGGYVFFDAFRADNQLTRASYAIADILSRQTEINDQYIDGLNTMLDVMVTNSERVWTRVTSVTYTTAGGYEVHWSYATGQHKPLTTRALRLLKLDQTLLPKMADGESVLLVETHLPYNPPFNVKLTRRVLSNAVVMRPRFTSKVVNTDRV